MLIWTLVLAAINQFFSLMDPQVLSRLIDNYLTKFDQLTRSEYITGVLMGLGGLVGVAMISRIAKNFQDYFVNVMTQKIGMDIYQETIQHTFSLPYKAFEDQQSGQLLQKLAKAKESLQTYISSLINIVFVACIGVLVVVIYSVMVDRRVALMYCLLLPIMGLTTVSLSKKIKTAQDVISKESAQVAGSITESIRNVSLIKMLWLVGQEILRLAEANLRILWLELKKVKTVRSIEFLQWTLINAMRVSLIGLLAYLVYLRSITIGELMSLYFYSFFLFGQLSMFGVVVKNYQEAKANHELLEDIRRMTPERLPDNAVRLDRIRELKFDKVSFSY